MVAYQALAVQRENQVFQELTEYQAAQEKRAIPANQASQEHQVYQELKEIVAIWAHQVRNEYNVVPCCSLCMKYTGGTRKKGMWQLQAPYSFPHALSFPPDLGEKKMASLPHLMPSTKKMVSALYIQ